MRDRGVPLAREAVLAARPCRGYLSVVHLGAGYPRQAFLCRRPEQRTASHAGSVLPPLSAVVLTRMAGDGFVIAGIERIEQFASLLEFHQAWWCRVVHDQGDGKS